MNREIQARDAGKYAIALMCTVIAIILTFCSIAVFGQDEYVLAGEDTLEQYAIHTSELIGYGEDHVVYQEFDGYLTLIIYGRPEAIKRLSRHIDPDSEPMVGGFHLHVLHHPRKDYWILDEDSQCNKRQFCSHYDGKNQGN